MNTALAGQPEDSVPNFLGLIKGGIEAINRGASMLARLHAKTPDVIHEITEQAPQIPASFLAKLLKVGEKALHPDLLLNGCAAYQQLARLPFSSQEAALKTRSVQLVIDSETGDALNVPLVELTPAQARQVISETGLRTKDEQRGFIRKNQPFAKSTEKIVGPLYVIRGKTVVCNVGCTLTQQDLLRLLQEMSK